MSEEHAEMPTMLAILWLVAFAAAMLYGFTKQDGTPFALLCIAIGVMKIAWKR